MPAGSTFVGPLGDTAIYIRRCSREMFMMSYGLLGCCSLLRIASLIPLACSENLTRPEPQNIGGSRADLRLPWYTSGFE